MPATTEVFKKYLNPYFVESGSHVGGGIQSAAEAGFENIISIELAEHLYNTCKGKFRENNKIKLIHGDVELVLWDAIKDINERITFWIDGHESGDDTACGIHGDPWVQELDIIKAHPIRNHTILIDDVRGNPDPYMIAKLKEINENYTIFLEDGKFIKQDILVAVIPPINE